MSTPSLPPFPAKLHHASSSHLEKSPPANFTNDYMSSSINQRSLPRTLLRSTAKHSMENSRSFNNQSATNFKSQTLDFSFKPPVKFDAR